VTLPRGADRCVSCRHPARRRAIRMATITRDADRKHAVAAATDFLATRPVHDVDAAARFDWTRRRNRGTRETDWLGPAKHRRGHRGSGGISSRPSPRPTARPSDYQQLSIDFEGRSAAAASEHRGDRDGRRAPAGSSMTADFRDSI
jgi:hypothetical protein